MQAHRLCVSLNSRLDSNKEEEEVLGAGVALALNSVAVLSLEQDVGGLMYVQIALSPGGWTVP